MSFVLNGVEIEDTFAEGFSMWGSRIIITAVNRKWANIAATTMTGFATSVIACDCEAGIEREVPSEETPDGRPGTAGLPTNRQQARSLPAPRSTNPRPHRDRRER